MTIVSNLLLLATLILVIYAALPLVSLLFAYAIPTQKKQGNDLDTDFACIITAYGNAEIAVQQVHSILQQSYSDFHIYLVADNCKQCNSFPVSEKLTVIYPETPLHSKLKSIQTAIKSFVRRHQFVLILDADNLLHYDALKKLNDCCQLGHTAIQGQRTAKNLDTNVAALDALGELYYNMTQRYAAFKIGSSATIAGSGMAVEAVFFTNYVEELLSGTDQIILAEDKLLQVMLVEKGKRIAYCRRAIIFDEKVRSGDQVQRQRTRWLRSWFQHWSSAIKTATAGLVKLNWNQFYFGVMLSIPPMMLHVAALLLMFFAGLFINYSISVLALFGLATFAAGFVNALILAPAPSAVWKAVRSIPYFAWMQVLAILKIKSTNKDFMATTHTQYLSIDEVWKERKQDFPYLKN